MNETAMPAAGGVCPNCGAPAPGRYCAQCGQASARELRSVAEYLREYFVRYLARGGVLWNTLAKLLFAPGALTLDYLAGRRSRTLRPLQLYLAVSLVVFAAAQVHGLNLSLRLFGEHGVHLVRGAALPPTEEKSIGVRFSPLQLILDHVDTAKVRRFASLSAVERFDFLHARRVQYISSFILFMVPVFALILKLGYRRRYAEHLVFGLHAHSFALLILLAESVLPAIAANLLSIWVLAYVAAALKRVHGGSWSATLARVAMIGALYLASYFAGNFLLILAQVEW